MSKKLLTITSDMVEQFEMLTNDEVGLLIRALIAYNDRKEIMKETESRLLNFVFMQIKSQLDKDADISAKRREAARLGNIKRWGDVSQKSQIIANHRKTENNDDKILFNNNINNNNIIITNNTSSQKSQIIAKVSQTIAKGNESDFDTIWNLYDKKVDRKKCSAKWEKLTSKEKQQIFEHVPKYVAVTPEKRYRKNFLTYLNGECWNDDIETTTNTTSYEQQRKNERRERQQTIANIMAEAITK